MRFRHPDGSVVHLAYCTNVHPAENLEGVRAQLRDHCEPVRKRLGRDRLGIGLWLARDAARTLINDPAQLRSLRAELDHRGLEVVTLNGFPYEGFGAEEVKYRVYKPDWTDPERLAHTTDLARLLATLLPDDVTDGTISTLPLAWRTPYTGDPEAARTALAALTTLGERLDALAELTGKSIRIGLEPEPGCTVETTADAIAPSPPSAIRASASASTRATSPPPSRTRAPHSTRSPPRASPPSRHSSPPPCTPNTPTSPRYAPRSPPSPNPASSTRPASPPPPGCAAPTTSTRRSAARPCPTAPPGAPTSTSPCTRRPHHRSPPPSPCSGPR